MEENENKINIKENEEKENEEIIYNFKNQILTIYKDKEIGLFLLETLNKNNNKIIEQLNEYYKVGNWRSCIILIKKLTVNKIFKLLNNEKRKELLDIMEKKLIPYIYIYSKADINVIIEFLSCNISYFPKDYIFDWKKFYSLIYIIDLFDSSNDYQQYFKFFKKLKKFIPKDIITFEDYQIMKKTILDDLVNARQIYSLCAIFFFLPDNFLREDDQLQLRFLYMIKNWKSNYIPCCCFFSKILSHNGKFLFSKDSKKNDEYIKEFIAYYFTYLNLYILNDSKVYNNNFINPLNISNNNDKKTKFEKSIIYVLIYLLFNENLIEYDKIIEKNLKIILDNKHLYLKEKSRDITTKNYIAFLQSFIYLMYYIFHEKKYDTSIEKKILILKPYENNKYIYDRLLLILKYFSLNFEKIFIFDNEGSCLSQRSLFSLLASIEINEDYMKQILININFENYLKMLEFLKKNSETRMGKYIMKLYTIMPLLLNEYVFSHYSNVREIIKESISFLSENVSSANCNVDIDILIIFCYEFFRIKDLSKKNKIYEFLIPIITDSTITIMKNLLRILDLINKKNFLDFKLFILSMKNFLDKEAQKQISLIYLNFIENNEIESSNLEDYYFVLNEEEQISIFNYIYNNLLFVDDSNNIEINKHFLYEKIDKDFNINVSHCSIEIFNEKQLEGYSTIFPLINYTKLFSDKSMIKKFYELYYALTNQKDKKFKKLGIDFFGEVLNSLIECKINEKNIVDGKNKPLIEYPSKEIISIVDQMYEKLILPYEKVVIEYLENNIIQNKNNENIKSNNNNEIKNNVDNNKNNKIIDKNTFEQIIYIYMNLVYIVSYPKSNIILNINFEDENSEEYKIIENQIKLYKKFKNYLNNSLELIIKIFDYNQNNLNNELFNNHLTSIYLDLIISLKLKTNNQKTISLKNWYKNMNQIIYRNRFINNFKNFYIIHLAHINNYRHFEWIKLFIPKDKFYYIYLKLFLLSYNSVNHPSSTIIACIMDFYSINSEKIKTLFFDIFNIFIEKLENIKADLLTEQNIMKNIAESYNEFSLFYISLYPYDALDVIEKLFKIILILKKKKFRRLDLFISIILSQIKLILQVTKNIEPDKDKRYSKYSKKNEIIGEEMNKIYQTAIQSFKNQNYLKKYNDIIKIFIEKSLNIIYESEDSFDKNDKKSDKEDLNQSEIILFFSLLVDYIKITLDKKDDLYRKVIQIIFNNITQQKVQVPLKILWIQKLYNLLQEEYYFYHQYEWIIFKSEEEYLKLWNKLKYEKTGKESMISYPLERIRINKFVFDEHLNKNLQYDFNIEKFLSSMGEIDEWEEDQKLVKGSSKKINSLDEVVSKLVMSRFNEKKGLDFKKAKMFYYMFKLKYIDCDCDFVKNLNFSSEILSNTGEIIKQNCVIYEFLLGKYEYMFDYHLFVEKDRYQLWDIMNKFTRRIDKIIDERIYAFFNYILNHYALGDLEFIFKYDFYKYPIDFVADMYFLYHQDLPNLRCETKMFDNSKTEELLTRIFSTDENIILDINYLVYVLKMYYSTNGILKYNYYYFKSEYTDKLYEHFKGIIEIADTKHRRNALFTIYNFFFDYLNNSLPILKDTIQKMGLCINEFSSSDKTTRFDKGKQILQQIEVSFRGFTGDISFPALCDEIVDILNKEKDSNNTNKIVYLQVVNLIYKGQKHLNLYKYSSQEIFDCLYKVFSSIKNEELKKNFSSVFLSYFNDLTEEENKKFIEKYEKYIFENNYDENEDKNKYNYIYILMIQLLRFKIKLPEYIQQFIIKLKIVNKYENDKLKKIIIDALKRAMNYYHGSYIFMKENISFECKEVLEEMTKEKSYFV